MSSPFREVTRRRSGSLTMRGRSFLAAGGTAMACGLAFPEPYLVRAGALLAILPAAAALIARRSRPRLSCLRRIEPPRVPAGQPATVTVRLENVSRRRTGILVAEDAVPASPGDRRRFVLTGIEAGGDRELRYEIRPSTRGTFITGPLQIRVTGAFGLVEICRSFGAPSTVVVTPEVAPLPRTVPAAGEDDAAPRAYQVGDSLRRVHWKSTARHGELMVRREEYRRPDRASVFLDTRRHAHAGSGPSSSFEFAVSAAASIGTHLSDGAVRVELFTEAGRTGPHATLLDTLTAITVSEHASVGAGASALAGAGGQLIVIAGRLSPGDAATLAASRPGSTPGLVLLLAVSAWESGGTGQDTVRAGQMLSAAGWRVAVVTAGTPLAAAWRQLHQPPGLMVPGRRLLGAS